MLWLANRVLLLKAVEDAVDATLVIRDEAEVPTEEASAMAATVAEAVEPEADAPVTAASPAVIVTGRNMDETSSPVKMPELVPGSLASEPAIVSTQLTLLILYRSQERFI